MSFQLSTPSRNAELDAIETAISTSPIMRMYNGSLPANCAAALSGNTLLVEGTLPADWMNAASSGSKTRSGTWSLAGQSGAGAGTTATIFRIYASDGVTCVMQGTVTVSGGGGDLTLDNASISSASTVTVNTFTLTAANS